MDGDSTKSLRSQSGAYDPSDMATLGDIDSVHSKDNGFENFQNYVFLCFWNWDQKV